MPEFPPSRLGRNALANLLQAILGSVALLLLYRFINAELSVAQLGVWSVVLATASASRLAELGLSAGVTRFVARDCARGDHDRAAQVVDSSVLLAGAALALLLLLLYLPLHALLGGIFQDALGTQAQALLPYALVSLWLGAIASIFMGALDGLQRMDLRAVLMLVGQCALLLLALALVRHHGLTGLALAQIGQSLLLLLGSRLLLVRLVPTLGLLPRAWNRNVLRELLKYGANIQFSTAFMLLFDPITKALLARWAGATEAGYFEMASQVVMRVRALILSANQAIVPYVAELMESSSAKLVPFYRRNMQILGVVTLPTFALLTALSGWLSWLVLGSHNQDFIGMLSILALAWGVNVFAGPAYFNNLGTGNVHWNSISHGVMGILNLGAGIILGRYWGTPGVVLGYAFALLVGSGILLIQFERLHRPAWLMPFVRRHAALIMACFAVASMSLLAPIDPQQDSILALIAKTSWPCVLLGALVASSQVLRRDPHQDR